MDKLISISVSCISCHKVYKFDVSEAGLNNFDSGMLIQKALPELDAGLREMLISKICPKCWDIMFQNEED
jgi:hypothetical protein